MDQLDWKTAAKAMIDGHICIDLTGDEWRWNESRGQFEWSIPSSDVWEACDITKNGPYTIKKEPVKYSVDVWFTETPKADADAVFFMHYLFGRNIGWSAAPSEACNQKYRITVEEVE